MDQSRQNDCALPYRVKSAGKLNCDNSEPVISRLCETHQKVIAGALFERRPAHISYRVRGAPRGLFDRFSLQTDHFE